MFSINHSFAINLQTGSNTSYPRDDIALHLSPVFSPPPRIVRNSLRNQSWGPEESHGGFPLVAGQAFEIMILVEDNNYKIAINGTHFTEFQHRIPTSNITHIAIDGEVQISLINITESGQPASAPPPVSAPHVSSGLPYPTGPSGFPVPSFAGDTGFSSGPGFSSGYPPGGPGYPPGGPGYPQPGSAYPQAGQSAYPQGGQSAYPQGGPSAYPAGRPGYPPAYDPLYPSGGSGYPTLNPNYPAGPSYAPGGRISPMPTGRVSPNMPHQAYPSQVYPQGVVYPGVQPGYPHGKQHKSSPIPIGAGMGMGLGGVAAGVGAAALGAAMLHKPVCFFIS